MIKRIGAALAASALALLLAACLLSPGKFESSIDLRKDGQFAFTYKGEIYLLALSKMAGQNATAKKKFEAQPCQDGDGTERKCLASEVAQQKKDWLEEQKGAAEKSKQDAENAKAFLGGIDPSDPKAAEELAARLRRQAGYRSVIYKGDGLYLVDFALAGRLDHDFVFPTIERFAMANAFVQISRRNDGSVRVDAPGFGPNAAGSPFAAMMGGMGGMLGASESKDATGGSAKMPVADGMFTITTNGTILSNSTDEGPRPDPLGQRLTWAVNPRSLAAPMALIKLGN